MAGPDELEVFVIPAFHWDRAWYESFQKFRIRLIDVMDLLLDILERRSEYKYSLDGQTSVLDDYLEIRPEKEEVLKKFVSEGRIAVGPWYVLPDEKIPGEEAHIRNLLTGQRIAKKFGEAMKAGYSPDAFGHISQLPQILQGFGIKTAFFSRGIPEGTHSTEFMWNSPDGSSVVAYNASYCRARHLGTTHEYGLDFLVSVVDELAGKSTTKVIAAMANVDHLEPQEKVIDIVNEAKAQGMNIRIATINELLDRVAQKDDLKQAHTGECPPPLANFRDEFLPGVLSTRTYLKQANSVAENSVLLAEHLCTIAADLGHPYPASLLRRAWRYILQCHPHDDICGCSRDVVHRDDMYRLEQASEIAGALIYRSMDDKHPRAFEQIVNRIDTSGFSRRQEGLAVYNRLGWEVSGLVRFKLDSNKKARTFHLLDEEGKQVPCAIKRSGSTHTIEFLAEGVPSCGYKTYRVVKGKAPAKAQLVRAAGNTIENKFLKVCANEDGSLDILDKTTAEVYRGANIFTEDEDAGHTYNHSRAEFPQHFVSTSFKTRIESVENTGLCAVLALKCVMRVPQSLTGNRKSRSKKLTSMEIVSRVILEANSRVVRFETTIDNTAKDHRVSVKFPTGIKTEVCHAEGHFDVMRRPTELPEEIYHRYNVRNYIAVHHGSRGAALIPDGLCEYEATKGPDATVNLYLTLLRCVGYLACECIQSDVPGPTIETPDAQCLGTQTFRYAFMPCSEREFSEGACFRAAYEHNNELITHPVKKHRDGSLPPTCSFLRVPDGLILSALKRGEENQDRTYIRVWNPGNERVEGALTYFRDIASASTAGLDETARDKLHCEVRNVTISVAPKQILTVRFSPA